ncbi:helix-turn-helix domain-containing protein [Arthrobacter sp. Sr33]
MSKIIGYEWRLREQLAAAGMFSTTKLIPLLEARGVHLSPSQVYRLVAERPERLNLHVLMALTDILGCSADDLIVKIDLGRAQKDKAAGETGSSDSASAVIRSRALRPRPARVTE